MQIFLFFALFIAILAVIFAVQNSGSTDVSFLAWHTQSSLAFVLLVALAAGALISFFVSLPSNIKTRWTIRQQRKKLTEYENSLAELKLKLEDTQRKSEGSQAANEPKALPAAAKEPVANESKADSKS
jgi:uncharacterized integral membrane protein